MATIIRGSDNFNTNDNATQTELGALSPQMATAWVNFDGTAASPMTIANGGIRDAYNISQVVRNSTGEFSIYFTVAMDNVNYSSTISGIKSGNGFMPYGSGQLTDRANLGTLNHSGAVTEFAVTMVQVFGGKA